MFFWLACKKYHDTEALFQLIWCGVVWCGVNVCKQLQLRGCGDATGMFCHQTDEHKTGGAYVCVCVCVCVCVWGGGGV